jgi:hypothetical protein
MWNIETNQSYYRARNYDPGDLPPGPQGGSYDIRRVPGAPGSGFWYPGLGLEFSSSLSTSIRKIPVCRISLLRQLNHGTEWDLTPFDSN